MWNTACTNKICFTQDKTYEQNLHLKRLFCTRPQINVSKPFIPEFLLLRGPQKEKRKQIQDKIDKENFILDKKKLEVLIKNGKYSKYVVEPKETYPAFRRYSKYKISDIINFIHIYNDNQRLKNKISTLKSIYDNGEMRKEAENQEKYLQNILNRPKSIPFTPALNFISIDQLHRRLKNQLIKQQYFTEQNNNGNKNSENIENHIKTNSNNSKIKGNKNNKSENKTNRSQRSQSSKNKRSLKINSDLQIENEKNNEKKTKKETGTTNANTMAKK